MRKIISGEFVISLATCVLHDLSVKYVLIYTSKLINYRSQGYMRPGQRDLRISDYEVEIPDSSASPSPDHSPTNSRTEDEVVDFLS